MAKQTSSSTPPPRLCPTCGTRVGELATKCIVCGADLGGLADSAKPQRQWRSLLPQRPTLKTTMTPTSQAPTASAGSAAGPGTASPASVGMGGAAASSLGAAPAPVVRRGIVLPVPVALGLILLFIGMGIVLVLGAMGVISFTAETTPTITFTFTPPPTFTPRPTDTPTPEPSPTPLPPIAYTVVSGDSCISIAVRFNISLQALLDANGLSQACPLIAGQALQVPQPTNTPTPQPTNTLEPGPLTETARPRQTYTVAAGDTLFSIAARFNVDYQALAEENGIPGPDYPITTGQVLTIPLDRPPPTAGPTPTNTPLPPYPAPNLLSPPNGAAISPVEQTVILQWAAVDVLKEGEAYLVIVEDLTCNCAKLNKYVTTQTRYIVTVDMKPAEAAPHIFKWTVVTVRQAGATEAGEPIYEPAGATSEERTFTWTGIGLPTTATPPPSP